MGYSQYLINIDRKEFVTFGKAGEELPITILKHLIKEHEWNFNHKIELVSYWDEVEEYIYKEFKRVDINFNCQKYMIDFLHTL